MMRFVIKDFLSDEYSKAINILKDNLKEHYHVFYGVRLSEILFPAGEYGSETFFRDFEEVNSITVPLIIFDTYIKKPLIVISFGTINYDSFLRKAGINSLVCQSLSDLVKSDLLINLYKDQV